MKKSKLFYLLFLVSLLTLPFISCTDDNEEELIISSEALPTNIVFVDTDLSKENIAGELTWTKPLKHRNISKLVIYTSEDGTSKKDKVAEIDTDIEKYTITNRDVAKYFIFVAIDSDNNEIKEVAKAEIKNAYTMSGIYILNGGKMGNNNAKLSFYDFATKNINSEVFEEQNGISLGDTGQDAIVYGSKIYIAVYGSGLIYATDLDGKILGTIESEKGGKKQQPRGLTAYEGKVYATLFDGHLAKIDTTKLEIEAQVAVGRNPEYVRAANNKLYVANSGGLDYNTPLGYDKTVSVIDVATFKETEKLDVVINPDKLAVDSQGDIYVISNGNYKDIPNTLQRIDATTHKVTKVGNASYMSINNDKLYIIYSQYDANWNQTISYSIFDTKTEKTIADNFITDDTKIDKPYSIKVDPINNNIYIGASDYTNNGDMYIFSKEGKLIEKLDTKGLNPQLAFSASWITRR